MHKMIKVSDANLLIGSTWTEFSNIKFDDNVLRISLSDRPKKQAVGDLEFASPRHFSVHLEFDRFMTFPSEDLTEALPRGCLMELEESYFIRHIERSTAMTSKLRETHYILIDDDWWLDIICQNAPIFKSN